MQFGELNWPETKEHVDKVVVLPLGSLEQHGPHLPLLTDTLIGTEIARRAAVQLGDSALFLPTVWTGASDHHRGFAGTVSVSNNVYVRLLVDILDSLIGGGFRRVFLLNAHGGNITPGRMAIYEAQMHHGSERDLWLAFSSWWTIAADQVASIADLREGMVTHACEQETSVILQLRPELVSIHAAQGANIPFDSAFYCPGFDRPSRVDVPRAFHHLSKSGAFGHPELATADKGEQILSAAVHEVVAFVREFARWPRLEPI